MTTAVGTTTTAPANTKTKFEKQVYPCLATLRALPPDPVPMPSSFSFSSSCFLSKFSPCLLRWKECDNRAFFLRGPPGVSLCLFPLPPSSSASQPQHHGSHLASANAASQTSLTLLQSHTGDRETQETHLQEKRCGTPSSPTSAQEEH